MSFEECVFRYITHINWIITIIIIAAELFFLVLYVVWMLTFCQKYSLEMCSPTLNFSFQPIDCSFAVQKVQFDEIPFGFGCPVIQQPPSIYICKVCEVHLSETSAYLCLLQR